jgi:glycosyltransferase involved in cell wall biosynthesis
MATGNGAYVVHKMLEAGIDEYHVRSYNPYWTLAPCMLPAVVPFHGARLIHTSPDYACFFSRASVPLVVTFHNYVLDRWMRLYSSTAQIVHYATDLRLWTRMALEKACIITAVSNYTARLVTQDLKTDRPIRVIYNGVDTDHFTPATVTGEPRKEIRVLFSGNLTRRKGAQWLPAIARRLKRNIRIFYTRGLQPRGKLEMTENLESIGSIPFDEMPACYRSMDILLMPTVREGFGLAVAEAMACGLPVVASDCSAIPELLIHGKGGFLCPVGDVDAFAEKINLLAENYELRREMGEFNRARVEAHFTLRLMIRKYQELFEEISG